MIKKSILYVLFLASSMHICAQIPNFGTTVGDQKLYGYSSMKYRAKADTWEFAIWY